MAILIDERTKVIVQGITGRTGGFATRYMLEYGTKVIGGVSPGRGGDYVWGVPVYNSVDELVKEQGVPDVSLVIVPPQNVRDACAEALRNSVKHVHISTEKVPIHDVLWILAFARRTGARITGPGSFGIISPGRAVVGWIGGSLELANEAFKPGVVGVISRSGGQTTTVSWLLGKEGLGVSTAVHVGAEPIVGTTEAELLELFEGDSETQAVVIFGEIGGVQEEEAAELISSGVVRKPVIAYIAGRTLPKGIRYSHASAIVVGERGSAESKIKALEEAGVRIVYSINEIPRAVRGLLKK